MSWDKHVAVEYARRHAGNSSQKKCAHFVSEAIRAGGAILHNTNHAKDMASNYTQPGFAQCLVKHEKVMSPLFSQFQDILPDTHAFMVVTATGIQILNSTACTLAQRGVKPDPLINSTDGIEMKKIILTGLLISSSTFASVSPIGPKAAALKFNHWYIAQLLQGKEPLTDYRGLAPYVTANTIAALKASNSADPDAEDVPDVDMFIKAQDFFDAWRQITVVSSDFDPVCYQVYVSFGVKQEHTVIDCMVKEDNVWKVQSVAGQEILRNVILK